MSLVNKVLPRHLKRAIELVKIKKDCEENQRDLHKQYQRAKSEMNIKLSFELTELIRQQQEQATKAIQELSRLYSYKKDTDNAKSVAQRMRDIQIDKMVIRKIKL